MNLHINLDITEWKKILDKLTRNIARHPKDAEAISEIATLLLATGWARSDECLSLFLRKPKHKKKLYIMKICYNKILLHDD